MTSNIRNEVKIKMEEYDLPQERVENINRKTQRLENELKGLEDFNKTPSMNEVNNEARDNCDEEDEDYTSKLLSSTSNTYFVYDTTVISDPNLPRYFKEAMKNIDRKLRIISMKEEINNFLKRNLWKNIDRMSVLRRGKIILRTKKVFKIKQEHDGSKRYKMRDVFLGFMKIPGVDYTESYSPVSKDSTIRTALEMTLFH